MEQVQSHTSQDGKWTYTYELKRWVDDGMDVNDSSFIDGVSGIVNRGCHDPPNCGTGELDGAKSRAENFQMILHAMFPAQINRPKAQRWMEL